MCGRIEYVITDTKTLEDHYGAKLIEGYAEQGFSFPHYNIPPTDHTPVMTSENDEEILIGHWGFVPSWAKTGAKVRAVINARAETVQTKPYFKSAIEKRRCLIPVTGYFEWKREGKQKTPYRFHMHGDLFSLAGIYTVIKDEDGIEMPHYAIITTTANNLMAPVHDRMPVVVAAGEEVGWLTEGLTGDEIFRYFKPNTIKGLVRDEISSLVNSPKHDTPEILKPVV